MFIFDRMFVTPYVSDRGANATLKPIPKSWSTLSPRRLYFYFKNQLDQLLDVSVYNNLLAPQALELGDSSERICSYKYSQEKSSFIAHHWET